MTATDTTEGLRRALTPVLALALLSRAPRHGYALIADLRTVGVGGANGGTIYPLLRSLEKDGLVSSTWDVSGPGPARKVFHLTDLGAERLAHDRRTASDLLQQVARLGLPE
ncbi:PadR family transcriptional regulator [Cellulomonas sp. NPDC057328]|uniref:PadR family transcriptional regulator n=1 Tax=Cellulomonas sp. NPDC057328 TaxID=3346101 RepID=UPI00363ED03F